MGGKPSWQIPADRPESGGADKDERLEKSGLLDENKQKFAQDRAERAEEPGKSPRRHPGEQPAAPHGENEITES